MNGQEQMDNRLVTYHRDGHIGKITLNRPDKRNALNTAVWEALAEAVEAAVEDTAARVVILQGAGKSFCAGLDLSPDNEIISIISSAPNATQKMDFYRIVKRAQAAHNELARLSRPTIAAIQGHCLGAGLEMALCCDIRICSEGTQFGLPEAALAIITDVGGLQRLQRLIGPGFAREIAFLAHRFDHEYAFRIGLVNHVCADEASLKAKALEMADRIAANPPLAVQGAKDVFVYDEDVPLSQSLDYNAARSSMIVPSEDIFEAMAAFMQKRKGEFKGA